MTDPKGKRVMTPERWAEAIDLYLSKLADGGLLIFNTTNRYVDLRPVLADLARSRDLVCMSFPPEEVARKYHAEWVVLQRRAVVRSPASWACTAARSGARSRAMASPSSARASPLRGTRPRAR